MARVRFQMERVSAPTGYCTKECSSDVVDVREFLDEFGREVTASVSVWDEEEHDFIFYKRCMDYRPETDCVDAIARWDAIASYMDDDIREDVHSRLAPCGKIEFLREYCKLDEGFGDFLWREFSIAF